MTHMFRTHKLHHLSSYAKQYSTVHNHASALNT